MKVTIENVFCRYSDEATDIYFRILNTILFSIDEAELRTSTLDLRSKQEMR